MVAFMTGHADGLTAFSGSGREWAVMSVSSSVTKYVETIKCQWRIKIPVRGICFPTVVQVSPYAARI